MALSFPMLVNQLIEEHHDGCLLRMARATGLRYSTLWRWERGMTAQPDYVLLRRLCKHYNLDENYIWDLIHRDARKYASGQHVPVADVSFRRRGPVPRKYAQRKYVRRTPRERARERARQLREASDALCPAWGQ